MTITGSKYCIPRISNTVLSRPRLLAKLDKGLKSKLTIITAPSGYGKTTVMSEWLREQNTSVVWITLEKEDDKWITFWNHIISGIGKEHSLFENMDMKYNVQYDDTFFVRLLEHLHLLKKPIIIVLDDFHFIQNEMIFQDFSYLLKQLPLSVHLYVISRVQPALRLSKLDINDDLNQLKKDDFLFDARELDQLDVELLDLQLTKVERETIMTRTEGWVTGIKLAVLIMHNSDQVTNRLETLSGRHPKIIAYFLEEVFEQQPAQIQNFLLQTAILSSLTSELCKETTGLAESNKLLQEIVNRNLFLTSVEGAPERFRYHRLFQEFLMVQLQKQFPTEMIKQVHLKAGLWLESNGVYKDALEHFVAADSYEKAICILEGLLSEIFSDAEERLWKLVEKIPNELLYKKPTIYLKNLASLYLDGKTEEATEKYQWMQQRLLKKDLPKEVFEEFQSGLLLWNACKSYLEKDYEAAIKYTRKYLRNDPDGNLLLGFGMEGGSYHKLLENSEPAINLATAERQLHCLVKLWSTTKNVYFYAQLCIDYGKLLYEWNRLKDAEEYVVKAIEIGQGSRNLYIELEATILLIKIRFATEQEGQAAYLLERIRNLSKQESNLKLIRKVQVFEMKRNWHLGKKELIKKWASEAEFNIDHEITGEMLDEYILWVTILMETGEVEQAKELLGRLLWQSQNEGGERNVIRVLLYQSVLLERAGQQIQCFNTFEEALFLAKEDKYLRTFIDIGKPMASLFKKYLIARKTQAFELTNEISIDYVKYILNQFPLEDRLEVSVNRGRKKGILTERELEVLRYMESGLLGKDIAANLNIAMSTMKTHTNNIYRKLQVNSRLQAVRRAKLLKIIEEDPINRK